MAVHHAIGISRQRNSGYRPRRVNIMAQGIFTPDPSLSLTHLIQGEIAQQLNTTHTIRLAWGGVAQHYTNPIPGVAHWASL